MILRDTKPMMTKSIPALELEADKENQAGSTPFSEADTLKSDEFDALDTLLKSLNRKSEN
jgi:hypothetical protein